MLTYTLAIACILLFAAWFWKKMMIFLALALAWGGVIYNIYDMSKYQDMTNSEPIQWVAGVIMLWAILQFFHARQGDNV